MCNSKEKNLRLQLRATIEANRIARLSYEIGDEHLKKIKKQLEKAVGSKKEWLTILIESLEKRLYGSEDENDSE
uniref:Uncharacterized protein n=1 Tax=viral metagenome TaxID=1070528 RepID=A0A6C0D1W8_9ZZZZ